MLESRTALQQQREYARLEPYWDGEREARGDVNGLSSYIGRSSLHHSANWERLEQLEHGEAKGNGRRPRGRPMGTGMPPRSKDPEILLLLKKGCSYGAVTRKLDVSVGCVRRVARENGLKSLHPGVRK
jgi:hypothetical protein